MSKHARPILVPGRFDVQNSAACPAWSTGNQRDCGTYCPRHQPTAYADHMARHATDSISPASQADRAAAFHNFGITR